MYKLIFGLAFVFLVGFQIWVPANMIYVNTMAISEGTPYKFKTLPIDPNDPFRGKYVALNFEMDRFFTKDSLTFGDHNTYGKDIYVYLKKDSLGYAVVSHVSLTKEDSDQDYVIAQGMGYYFDRLDFQLPFDRFYMEEGKALEAELAVREASVNMRLLEEPTSDCYALVFVNGDRATLEQVFIDEVPLDQVVLNNRKSEE